MPPTRNTGNASRDCQAKAVAYVTLTSVKYSYESMLRNPKDKLCMTIALPSRSGLNLTVPRPTCVDLFASFLESNLSSLIGAQRKTLTFHSVILYRCLV